MAVTCDTTPVFKSSCGEEKQNPYEAALCGHTPEDFAECALKLEPRGFFWCKDFGTIKSALYRAFGKLLSDFEQKVCVLFNESLACNSVELLDEWEQEYGLPPKCAIAFYPTDLAGRQAMVCAARNASNRITTQQLEDLLQLALNCEFLKIENTTSPVGICISGIASISPPDYIHNVVGGWGLMAGGFGSSAGQPLTILDPDYVHPQTCAIIYHATTGGWTGGVGQPLMFGDPARWNLLLCLMSKYCPAHVYWTVCDE